jgi:hypothetical protein
MRAWVAGSRVRGAVTPMTPVSWLDWKPGARMLLSTRVHDHRPSAALCRHPATTVGQRARVEFRLVRLPKPSPPSSAENTSLVEGSLP